MAIGNEVGAAFLTTMNEVAPKQAKFEFGQIDVFFKDMSRHLRGMTVAGGFTSACSIYGADATLTGAQVNMAKHRAGVVAVSRDVVVVSHWLSLGRSQVRVFLTDESKAEPVDLTVKGEAYPGARLTGHGHTVVFGIRDFGQPGWATTMRDRVVAAFGTPASASPPSPESTDSRPGTSPPTGGSNLKGKLAPKGLPPIGNG